MYCIFKCIGLSKVVFLLGFLTISFFYVLGTREFDIVVQVYVRNN